jgi:hypothetical protein
VHEFGQRRHALFVGDFDALAQLADPAAHLRGAGVFDNLRLAATSRPA